jgi:hypothetical protein
MATGHRLETHALCVCVCVFLTLILDGGEWFYTQAAVRLGKDPKVLIEWEDV